MRTATAAGGREVKRMSWVRDVDFTEQEIDDLYAFLRKHDGLSIAIGNVSDRPSAERDKVRRAAGWVTSNYAMQRSARRLRAAEAEGTGFGELARPVGADPGHVPRNGDASPFGVAKCCRMSKVKEQTGIARTRS